MCTTLNVWFTISIIFCYWLYWSDLTQLEFNNIWRTICSSVQGCQTDKVGWGRTTHPPHGILSFLAPLTTSEASYFLHLESW